MTCSFERFNLILQLLYLLVLILHIDTIHSARATTSQSLILLLQLGILLNQLLVLSVQLFILRDHALFVLKHLVQVIELLSQENCLVADYWINTV